LTVDLSDYPFNVILILSEEQINRKMAFLRKKKEVRDNNDKNAKKEKKMRDQ